MRQTQCKYLKSRKRNCWNQCKQIRRKSTLCLNRQSHTHSYLTRLRKRRKSVRRISNEIELLKLHLCPKKNLHVSVSSRNYLTMRIETFSSICFPFRRVRCEWPAANLKHHFDNNFIKKDALFIRGKRIARFSIQCQLARGDYFRMANESCKCRSTEHCKTNVSYNPNPTVIISVCWLLFGK